jgi:hypothetical protein
MMLLSLARRRWQLLFNPSYGCSRDLGSRAPLRSSRSLLIDRRTGATWNRSSGLRGNTYTSHDPSPCKRLKDGNGADSRKSQSALSPGRQQQICAGSPVTGLISQNFPPDLRAPASKSLRLGWDFHTSANCFQICPRPLHTYR